MDSMCSPLLYNMFTYNLNLDIKQLMYANNRSGPPGRACVLFFNAEGQSGLDFTSALNSAWNFPQFLVFKFILEFAVMLLLTFF